jgi:CHAT domain-containing protein
MKFGPAGYFIVAGLLSFPLRDGSGQDARPCGKRAEHAVAAGKLSDALALYQLAYRQAEAGSLDDLRQSYLNNIGACQLALFRYKDAAETLHRVRKRAEALANTSLLAGADANLASLYDQTNDLSSAELYAREALRAYSKSDNKRLQARAMMTLADILSNRQLTREGEGFFQSGIEAATAQQDWASASTGWLHYGGALLRSRQLDGADRALTQSYRLLRMSKQKTGESAVLWNLSRLRLLQKDLRHALAFIDEAIRVSPVSGGRITTRRLYQTRAQIELAMGNDRVALQDARTAIQSARLLRSNNVPDNEDRVGMEGVLDEGFSILIEAGNRVYLKTHDPEMLRETFEAAEENRAESLEYLLPAASNWRTRVATPEYRFKLSQLLSEQRIALLSNTTESRERFTRLQSELSQMEANAGSDAPPPTGTALERVRQNLPPGAAFLSFRLGERASWLWTIERGDLHLYRLPSKATLMDKVREFQDAVVGNDLYRVGRVGRQLYRDLFGGSNRSFAQSSQWFISLDEPLYTLPLSALVVDVTPRGPVFLTQRKTLRIIPGAQLLRAPQRGGFSNRRFVLAGDGIYNRADPRFGKSGLVRPASWGMARLPGSGREVRFAANLWHQASLLTGAQLTKEALLKEIDRDPDVIHIASHIVEGQDRWRSGILALGIDSVGEPDLLTPREIELHPIHSRLVVMSGCSSASAEILPASGLMGLTRAWLAAGAGEVLATRWPATDESGDGLIGSFYRHLVTLPDGNIPEALREARLEMLARGGWRSEPRYWSSFFLIGVE